MQNNQNNSQPLVAPKSDVGGCRGRDTGCPAPPSQIPAGGIPAPGSSGQLALAFAAGTARRRGNSANFWQKLNSCWQGILAPDFSTMLGRGTWKRASKRLTPGQV